MIIHSTLQKKKTPKAVATNSSSSTLLQNEQRAPQQDKTRCSPVQCNRPTKHILCRSHLDSGGLALADGTGHGLTGGVDESHQSEED